jgi:anti-anti-sigma factor
MGFSTLPNGDHLGMGLEITVCNAAGGTLLFVLSGELDISAVPRFRQMVEDVLPGASPVALDLRDVALVDSSGLGALLRLAQADGRRRPVVLVCQGPSIRRLLELTDLADRFIVVGRIDEIPAAFAAAVRERTPEDTATRDTHAEMVPATTRSA